MKAIKKVEVVPLDYNEGKIINSWNTTDDKTKNAPSMKIVEDKIVDTWSTTEDKTKIAPSMHLVDNKFNFFQNAITLNNQALNNFINSFAVLYGTIDLPASGVGISASTSVDYPDGFDGDNCVVISIMSNKEGGSIQRWATPQYSGTGDLVGNCELWVDLRTYPTSSIYVNASKTDIDASAYTVNFKIVLMKIS